MVGDEALAFLAEELFDDRMAAADDEEFPGGVEFGASVAAVGGEFGKGCKDVELRYSCGGFSGGGGKRGGTGAGGDEKAGVGFWGVVIGGGGFWLVLLLVRWKQKVG